MIAKACLLKSTASYPMLEDEMKTHFKVTIRVGTMQVEGVMFFLGFGVSVRFWFCFFLQWALKPPPPTRTTTPSKGIRLLSTTDVVPIEGLGDTSRGQDSGKEPTR